MNLLVTAQAFVPEVTVSVPGSKSVANRALICAMLADGVSRIHGVPDGDDTAVIVSVLQEVGRISRHDSVWQVSGSSHVRLPGIIDARLAGTSSRFLTAVAALGDTTTVIDGAAPLRSRPMNDLHVALRQLGANVEPLGDVGHLPVGVSGGTLEGGVLSIRGDVSSQFISALMLVGPLFAKGLRLIIEGELVSRSYVEMTAAVMRDFGAQVEIGSDFVHVQSGAYQAGDYIVEPDYSSAAFALLVPVIRGGSVRVPNLAHGHLQGDAEILSILSSFGCNVVVEQDDVVVSCADRSELRSLNVVMTDCSDLVPAVAVAMSVVPGSHRISGVGFIKNKESDRLNDLAREMGQCGANVNADDDGLSIDGVISAKSGTVDTHHDHRLAMALSLLALASGGITVHNADVVSKSWPSFFTDMAPILSAVEIQN